MGKRDHRSETCLHRIFRSARRHSDCAHACRPLPLKLRDRQSVDVKPMRQPRLILAA